MTAEAFSPDLPAEEFALFAHELAQAARRETLPRFSTLCTVDDKGQDGHFDPVTDADRAAESRIRGLIGQRYPEHGVCGEEFAEKPSSGRFTWSIDPIDGTRSYVCGFPTWTTLIALLEDGVPVLGVIDAPMLDETYLGTADQATVTRRDQTFRISTSGCDRLTEARFSTTDPFHFGPAAGALQPVLNAVRVTRFGHDGYAYARLAAGSIDLVIECGLKPHDYNALIPVVRAAGGHVGDWMGDANFAGGKLVAAASRVLYEEVVALLADA